MPIGPIIRAMNHNRTRFALIILEIAITLAIVTNAVNMILDERAEDAAASRASTTTTCSPSRISRSRRSSASRRTSRTSCRRTCAPSPAIPGVKAAAATYFLPWQGGGSSGTWKTEGYTDKFQAQLYAARGHLRHARREDHRRAAAFIETDTPVDPNTPTTRDDHQPRRWRRNCGATRIRSAASSPTATATRRARSSASSTSSTTRTRGTSASTCCSRPAARTTPAASTYLVRTEPGAMKAVVAQLEPRLLAVNARPRLPRCAPSPRSKDNFFSAGKLVITAMTGDHHRAGVRHRARHRRHHLARGLRAHASRSARAAPSARRSGDILKHFLTENWIVTTVGLILGVVATYALNFVLVSQLTDVEDALVPRRRRHGAALDQRPRGDASRRRCARPRVSPAIATRSV